MMLDPDNDMIFTVEDLRGKTVKVGDTIVRGVTVGQSADTRIGEVTEIKRIPQKYNNPNYYIKVKWTVTETGLRSGKETLVNINPRKNNGFVIVELD